MLEEAKRVLTSTFALVANWGQGASPLTVRKELQSHAPKADTYTQIIDSTEQLEVLFTELNSQLQTYTHGSSNESKRTCLLAAKEIYTRIIDCQAEYQRVVTLLVSIKRPITKLQDTEQRRLNTLFYHFIDIILEFDPTLAASAKNHIIAGIFRLMTVPEGQHLINRLTALHARTGFTVDVTPGERLEVAVADDIKAANKLAGTARDCIPSTPGDFKQHGGKGQEVKHMILRYPTNFHRQKLLTPGLEQLLVGVGIEVALAHEFIHLLHYGRGKARSEMAFRLTTELPIFHCYRERGFTANSEELWTIELGRTSQNSIGAALKHPPRGGHRAYALSGPITDALLKEIDQQCAYTAARIAGDTYTMEQVLAF